MAEEKDVFEEAFGEDPEEKEAIEKQKKKQEEKKVHEKTVHEESNDLSPEEMDQELERRVQVHRQEKKEKRKYAKRLSFSKPKVEKRVEQAEQQQAIKKMILDKARQAIQSKKKPVPKKSSTEESVEKAMEESQPVSETPSEDEFLGDDAMDAVLEESLLREEGIQEEGIHSNQSLSTMPIPKPMIQPAMVTPIGVPLNFLEDTEKDMVFIGRKKSVFKQFGNQAALFIGKVSEEGSVFHDKKVALDSLNPHVVFVCGARGSGKCLTGDTEIALDDGRLIPISELEKTNGKVLGLEHSLKIAPLHREGFFKRKVEKILKVKLRSGKRIKLTPEHPLLTVEGWRPTETLTVGSRIATPRALPAFGNGALRDCEVKVLSYLIAEGHLSNQFVLFSNTDETLKKDFIESVLQFHPNLRISEHSKPNCFRVAQKKRIVDSSNIVRNKAGQFTSNGFVVHKRSPLAEWLSSLDIYGKLSAGKFVPNSVLQLKKEQISLFLNRLFSCDGSIYRVHNRKKNWCIDYSSSSEKLIRQVQSLLLRFGILSRLREKTIKTNNKKFKVFELVVYGENVLRFITEIGFFGAKEKKQETAFEEMSGLSRNPNTDTIPREVWKEFPVSNWAEAGRKIGYASPKSLHNTVEYAPSREKLLRLAQIEENHGIQLLAQADIFWDEITEIKELTGEFEVFDISVPTHHNFVANDIIVHNSYVLGVIAEELALKNPNVGTIVVDPIGVFWSMRLPNREEKEVALLGKYDLMPQGVNNLKVFIPNGIATQVPKSTFDATFSLQPSLLTVEDWCLTFGMDRFSPTGLLLEKSLVKVKGGYENIEGKKVGGKQNRFSMEDLIWCLETDSELNSRDKGYKQDSIRALVSRFEAAKGWGIFDDKGTPLSQLSKEGQLTILDTSFLEDNVTSLVIGLLARRILAARKLSTRKEAAKRLKTQELDELLELEIPPTWLFIDEAHTLIPSGNVKTPATNALVEYVKQGRRPGCR
ncbi:DUF87 domain-containing protein [Patescibacteria group bacterium]|nr:DUF87 domain-containing protein [Patescibacteria group bacterium]